VPSATPDQIATCYQILLGREPDKAGFDSYVAADLPLELVVRGFLNSEEFRRRSTALRTQAVHGLDFSVPQADRMYDAAYEAHVFKEFRERVESGMTVLDVGANIGVFSVHASKRGASVIAVEALASNAKLLLDNAERHNVNIELHPLAASDRHGYARLVLGESLNAAIGSADGNVVATAPLDTLVGGRNIDVLKIDVEGHEYRAILGGWELLKRSKPVVFTEYSPSMQQTNSGVHGMDYLALFLQLGYAVHLLGENGPKMVDPESVDNIWESRNTSHLDLMLTTG
jgi:FkbM family methyltransferase